MKKYLKLSIGAVAIVIGLIAGSISPAWAANPIPGVIPPQAKPYGMTYGEWSARWWQWAYSLSVDHNPFFDEGGKCSNGANGQSGPVWFLTGVINDSGTAVRNCTVPSGKALFFPILNAECSTLEGDGDTEAKLRACPLLKVVTNPTNLGAEIDGRKLNIGILKGYRAESPLFIYGPLPDNNVLQFFGFDAPAGATSKAVADGFYLMLAPLSVGEHTIKFTGSVPGFTLDITYNLTIAPRQPQARLPQSHKAPGLWGRKANVLPK